MLQNATGVADVGSGVTCSGPAWTCWSAVFSEPPKRRKQYLSVSPERRRRGKEAKQGVGAVTAREEDER